MNFEFSSAGRIIFGAGKALEAVSAARRMGSCALVLTGSSGKRAEPLVAELKKKGLECVLYRVLHEPTKEIVMEATQQARQAGCDLVLGVGGGSVLDAGKAVAALLTNGGELMDYLEVIGGGQALQNAAAPYIAMPTTAGTGTEVTRNAVIGIEEHQVKVSLRSPLILPRLAVIDPELTYSMPPDITISSGMDALTQLIEPFVSCMSNPLTDGICREGLKLMSRSMRRVFNNGSDKEGRGNLALASLFGGLALANAKLGAVHGFAGPVGGMFDAPHGMICACLLPHVMDANLRALEERMPCSEALDRYTEVARLLTGDGAAEACDGIDFVQQLCRDFEVAGLRRFSIEEKDIAAIVEKSRRASSMKGNPIELRDEELSKILHAAL